MSAIPTKQLEFWLAGWTKSHNGGTKVTFTINDDDLPYFENATIRKGKHAGQRYAAVLVQLQDDDTPDPESVKPLAGVAKAHELAEAGAEGSALSAAHEYAKAASAKAERVPTKSHFPAGYCGLAVRWCDDVHFRGWLEEAYPKEWLDSISMVKMSRKDSDVERASVVIKMICRVNTRTKLDTEDTAHALFKEYIFKPYVERRDADGVDE